MLVLSVAKLYPASNGYVILRLTDKAGWLLCKEGCQFRFMFPTKKSALLYANNLKQ